MSILGVLDFLFGEDSFLAGVSIKSGLTPKKWRPGRRSVELRAKAIKKAQVAAAGPGMQKWLDDQRKRAKAAQTGVLTAPKPSPASRAGNQVFTPPPAPPRAAPGNQVFTPPKPVPVAPPRNGVFTPPKSPPRSTPRGAANLAMHGLAGLVEGAFFDGMGDPTVGGGLTPPAGTGPNGGTVVIDPITGLPIELPPGYTLDANGNLVAADEAPPMTPDGKPYTGNAQVWVSTAPIQFYWDPLGAQRLTPGWDGGARARAKLSDPVLYPDGTPVTGLVWLPKLDLQSMSPDMFRPFVRAIIETGQRSWPEGDGVDYWYAEELPGYRYKGTHSIEGDKMRAVEAGKARAPWGPIEPSGPRAEVEYRKGGDISHTGATVYYMGASFDWSNNDPTTAAYPFLYDWFAADLLQWKVMPADLWLSTGTPISNQQQGIFVPYQPSPLLHCLDFLDSLATGAHGMPKVLDLTTGQFDFDTFAAWCNQDPKWAQLGAVISAAKQRPFMIATIYDVTEVPVGPGVNNTVPVPPLPAPPIDPLPPLAPPLVDPRTGQPYPIDAATGLPYDPVTGILLDPSTGQPYAGAPPIPGDPSSWNTGGFVDWSNDPGYYDGGGGVPEFVPNDDGRLYDDAYYYDDGGYATPPPPRRRQQWQQPDPDTGFIPVPVEAELAPAPLPFADSYDIDDRAPLDAFVDDYSAQDSYDDETPWWESYR